MLSYIEISRDNLLHNLGQFKQHLHPRTKICVPVKGNAYGHGQNEVAGVLADQVDYLMVDDIDELRRLPHQFHNKTIVMGYVERADLEEVVESGATLVIFGTPRLPFLEKIGQQKKMKIPIHLKIDIYHGRQGILFEEVEEFIQQLRQFRFIEVQGVAAHFSSSDDPSDHEHTLKQIHSFNIVKSLFSQYGYRNLVYHISNTGGVLAYEKSAGENEMVRPGIGIYGMWPSTKLQEQFPTIKLRPVLRWTTHIAGLKTLPPDHPVGYNRTFITSKPTKVALIPQGYADGYDRRLSNNGEVLIQGVRCPILGRVAMNMFSVDVTSLPDVQQEDEVILIGNQKNEEISASEHADKIGTINYEVTTRISPLLPRVVV